MDKIQRLLVAENDNRFRNYGPLEEQVVQRAINLLFGSNISTEKKEALSEYIQKRYNWNACVALYISEADRKNATPKPFLKLCKVLNLDPGNREVIIPSNGNDILFTENYTIAPFKV